MNPKDKKRSITEKIWAWLKGDLRREGEAELARSAQDDPFLKDAWEGYQRFPEGEHAGRIKRIKGRLKKNDRKNWTLPLRIAAAGAAVVIVAGLSWWVMQDTGAEMAVNKNTEAAEPLMDTSGFAAPQTNEPNEIAALEEGKSSDRSPEKSLQHSRPQIQSSPKNEKKETPEPVEAEEELVEAVEEEVTADVPPPPPPAVTSEPEPQLEKRKETVAPMSTREETSRDMAARKMEKQDRQKSRRASGAQPTAPQYYAEDEFTAGASRKHLVEPALVQPVGGFENYEVHLDSILEYALDPHSIQYADSLTDPYFEAVLKISPDGTFDIVSTGSGPLGTGNEIQSFVDALKGGPRWEFLTAGSEKPVRVRYRYFPFKE